MTDDLQSLQHRVATLERQHRQLRVLVLVVLIIALAAKVVAIWSLTRPKPAVQEPPVRIAARSGSVPDGAFPLVFNSPL